MNIKRIIREEINNDLQWIKDVKPTLNDAFEQGTLKKGDVLTLSGELADCDAITTKEVNDFKIKITKLKKKINNSYFIPLQKKYWEHLEYEGKGDTRFYGSDGKMTIEDHHNNLNESNDLQWIRDIKPIPELKVGTCFIDVMDSTQTEWIIIDFKMTPGGTPIVVIKNKKNNTDIRYKHEGYFEEDLLSHRYKPCSNKLMESNEIEWIQGGPDFNLQTSEFYIDLDGVSNEETCEIQQKILDVGVYWSGKGKKLKKEHCNNSKAYIIKKGKLYISTYNYNKYNTMVKQLKDTTENFPRLYGKNFSQLFK